MQNSIPSPIERELRAPDRRRHWSSSSQTYASADILLDYLAEGWDIRSVVRQEVSWRGGGRHIAVHYFELTKDHQGLAMPVLDNPIVRRLVAQREARMVLLKWMMSDSLRMRSPRRDVASGRMSEAGARPAFRDSRPIHSALHEKKLVYSSEASV